MNWNELAREAHQVAVEKGLWDKPVTFDDVAIECHAALTRAWEEHKAGRPNLYRLCQPSGEKHLPCAGEDCPHAIVGNCVSQDTKPRGVAAELAVVVLRMLDWLEAQGSKDFAIKYSPYIADLREVSNDCHRNIGDAAYMSRFHIDVSDNITNKAAMVVEWVWGWFKGNHVDMEAVLREVLEYNRRRGKAEEWA